MVTSTRCFRYGPASWSSISIFPYSIRIKSRSTRLKYAKAANALGLYQSNADPDYMEYFVAKYCSIVAPQKRNHYSASTSRASKATRGRMREAKLKGFGALGPLVHHFPFGRLLSICAQITYDFPSGFFALAIFFSFASNVALPSSQPRRLATVFEIITRPGCAGRYCPNSKKGTGKKPSQVRFCSKATMAMDLGPFRTVQPD